MTRKDYILIASALRDAYNTSPSGAIDTYRASVFIANNLEIDNPKFDREHFLAVVRGEKDVNSKPENAEKLRKDLQVQRAASALLEALKIAREHWMNHSESVGALNQVDAAIAKAEGKL